MDIFRLDRYLLEFKSVRYSHREQNVHVLIVLNNERVSAQFGLLSNSNYVSYYYNIQ